MNVLNYFQVFCLKGLLNLPVSCNSRASLALATLSLSSLSLVYLVSMAWSLAKASSGLVDPSVGLLRSHSVRNSRVRASTALSSATIFCWREATWEEGREKICHHFNNGINDNCGENVLKEEFFFFNYVLQHFFLHKL